MFVMRKCTPDLGVLRLCLLASQAMAGAFSQHDDCAHVAYFATQQHSSNAEFWHRFGAIPAVSGKRVLDLGCGHGALSVELAKLGASVLGVDLDEARIDWAKRNAGDLADFACVDVANIEGMFDFIVSKDTFEHIADMEAMLSALRQLLASGGQIWAGFSPLYNSPWGDHGRAGVRIPWGHVLLPSRVVYALASRHQGRTVRSLDDLELNGITPRAFRRWVECSGLQFESVRYNQSEKKLLRLLDLLRNVPMLESLATVSIYSVLVAS
jgi:SAM-dependent methyltransferase